MKKQIFGLALLFGVGLALGTSMSMNTAALAAEKKKELTLAVIRTEEMSTLAKRWETAVDYLSKELNVDINFYTTTSYASVVEAMLSGFVDVASLGPKIYIVANEKSDGAIVPVVSYTLPADMFNDKPCGCYLGSLVTKTGSGMKTLESTKGKVLALVDPGSTSGNALPRALFPEKIGGVELEEYWGRVFYSGSHSASARAIQAGKADAAFISLGTLRRLIISGEMKKEDFNYLWISPEISIDVISVDKKRMKPEMVKALENAFMGMTETEEGRAVLETTGWAPGFQVADDAGFDPLRKILALKAKMKKKK
jgi:phosphonate transport system substrate-binding protein